MSTFAERRPRLFVIKEWLDTTDRFEFPLRSFHRDENTGHVTAVIDDPDGLIRVPGPATSPPKPRDVLKQFVGDANAGPWMPYMLIRDWLDENGTTREDGQRARGLSLLIAHHKFPHHDYNGLWWWLSPDEAAMAFNTGVLSAAVYAGVSGADGLAVAYPTPYDAMEDAAFTWARLIEQGKPDGFPSNEEKT